jgi:uncharacterized DUF497 family protein
VEFEWDPAKEATNVEKHGITFGDAATVFDDPFHLTEDSSKPEYGEERSIAIGLVAGRVVTVVYTDREEQRRIISARRSRANEQRRYDQGKTAR